MASQMQHFAGWEMMNWADPIHALLLSHNPHYHLLTQLESGDFSRLQYGKTFELMNKVCQESKHIMKYEGVSEYTLL